MMGYDLEEILGATLLNNQIAFLIKWEEIEEHELVHSMDAHHYIPTWCSVSESHAMWQDGAGTHSNIIYIYICMCVCVYS